MSTMNTVQTGYIDQRSQHNPAYHMGRDGKQERGMGVGWYGKQGSPLGGAYTCKNKFLPVPPSQRGSYVWVHSNYNDGEAACYDALREPQRMLRGGTDSHGHLHMK